MSRETISEMFKKLQVFTSLLTMCVGGFFLCQNLLAQSYQWSTFAGSDGGRGFRDGPLSGASFNNPAAVAKDGSGNLYIADSGNHLVRKITPDGVVATVAGKGGYPGLVDGPAGTARFKNPGGIVVDSAGFIYVADTGNHTIRKISPEGNVTTFAGQPGISGTSDGSGSAARFSSPTGVSISPDGQIYVADTDNHAIRRISSTGNVTTFAGKAGEYGIIDGALSLARFSSPAGLVIDSESVLYVADSGSGVIRMVTSEGNVTTIAGLAFEGDNRDGIGTAARFVYPTGIAVDADRNLYVTDGAAETIRKIAGVERTVTTLAGMVWTSGFVDGNGADARFFTPSGIVATLDGDFVVVDSSNHALRKISLSGAVSSITSNLAIGPGSMDGLGAISRFRSPLDLTVDKDDNVFVADTGNRTIRKITPSGMVSTFAGAGGTAGTADGSGTSAKFSLLRAITAGSAGRLFVADGPKISENTIREVSAMANVVTLAGTPDSLPVGESLYALTGLAADRFGNVFSTDISAIRRTTPGGVTTFLAGSKRSVTQGAGFTIVSWRAGSADGSGAAATFSFPSGIAIDAAGNLFVTESEGCVVRKVTSAGVVTTLAGMARSGSAAPEHRDGTGSVARFNKPQGIATDISGNMFIAETGSHTIRKMSKDGVVTTIGGLTGFAGSGIGGGDRALFNEPYGIAVDSLGNVFVADTANHRIVKGTPLSIAEIVVQHPDGRHLTSGDSGLDFGSVKPGSTNAPLILKIWNTGNAPLSINSLTLSGDQSSEFQIVNSTLPGSIPVGGGGTIQLTLTPGASGVRAAFLEITSNDADQPFIAVSLRGIGNDPPIFTGYPVSGNAGLNVTISLAKLIAAANDPDGDALRVTSVSWPSTPSGTLTLLPESIVFSPHPWVFSGTIRFMVTITDSRGGSTTGEVLVTIQTSTSIAQAGMATNPPKLSMLPDGKAHITFHGIPGRFYLIQRSTNLSTWEALIRIAADNTGNIIFVDPSPPKPNGYYRIATP